MNRKQRNRKRFLRILTGVSALAILLPFAAARAESPGRCIRAEVPAPMVLPDGSSHPAGVIRICLSRAYSPVAGLHETQVNGESIGMFLSQVGESEGNGGEPFFVFYRNVSDELVLQGYALPAGERLRTYHLQMTGRAKKEILQARHRPITAEPADDRVILLAALVR